MWRDIWKGGVKDITVNKITKQTRGVIFNTWRTNIRRALIWQFGDADEVVRAIVVYLSSNFDERKKKKIKKNDGSTMDKLHS